MIYTTGIIGKKKARSENGIDAMIITKPNSMVILLSQHFF